MLRDMCCIGAACLLSVASIGEARAQAKTEDRSPEFFAGVSSLSPSATAIQAGSVFQDVIFVLIAPRRGANQLIDTFYATKASCDMYLEPATYQYRDIAHWKMWKTMYLGLRTPYDEFQGQSRNNSWNTAETVTLFCVRTLRHIDEIEIIERLEASAKQLRAEEAASTATSISALQRRADLIQGTADAARSEVRSLRNTIQALDARLKALEASSTVGALESASQQASPSR